MCVLLDLYLEQMYICKHGNEIPAICRLWVQRMMQDEDRQINNARVVYSTSVFTCFQYRKSGQLLPG